jgi:hypothetical protein
VLPSQRLQSLYQSPMLSTPRLQLLSAISIANVINPAMPIDIGDHNRHMHVTDAVTHNAPQVVLSAQACRTTHRAPSIVPRNVDR